MLKLLSVFSLLLGILSFNPQWVGAKENNVNKAIKVNSHTVKDRSDFAQDHFYRGQNYQNQNRFIDALWEYNGGKFWHSYFGAKCQYFSGYCNVKLYRYWDAERDYEDYIQKFPYGEQVEPAHYVLGRVYEERFKNNEARNIYYRLIQRWPSGEYAWKARQRLQVIGRTEGDLNVLGHEQVLDTPTEHDPFSDDIAASFEELLSSLDKEKTDPKTFRKIQSISNFNQLHKSQ